MSWLSKYLGGQQGGQAPTGAETVERLCDRVQSSTLLEDRRDAVRALKSLSKKFRLEVGNQAIPILTNVLQADRSDAEILRFALETLCNVMSTEPSDDGDEGLLENAAELDIIELGNRFTENFVSTTDNVSLLLSLLDEYDFYVRWPTVRLLTILLTNRTKEIQEIILANPMGVSKLMDLLSDSRDVIRNDGMLLLTQLTKGNTNIQKIVAFENAFERLLDIISEEGSSDGGVVVEDSLVLLLNLLKNNISNQNFFKEGSFIKRLTPFFEMDAEMAAENEGGWSAQKVTNIHLMLQLTRALVSPSNPQLQTAACQKVMHTCGLLGKLCDILMASGVPADVLTETINTVSEIIRGNHSNQEMFASVMAPSNPPRPAIVVLLMSMVNDKQPFVLRCAVLYCFQSFLYKNELGQSQIIQTLLPTTAEVNTISAGQLLCGGLFSADSLSTWFAAVAMLHSIGENQAQKEQLLRVQLATSVGNPPVSLLQQCTNILAQGGKVQTRVGILMLLCNWLATCPIAVTHFLHNAANVPFLISQISASEGDEHELLVQGLCAFLLGLAVLFNNDQVDTSQKASSLRQIIEKRIGLEMFSDKLSQITKHESYSRAAKRPQITQQYSSDILFDYEFTRLVKKLENEVLKAISPCEENNESAQKRAANVEQHDSIVTQYKDIIREQDSQLNGLRSELQDSQAQFGDQAKQLDMLKEQVQQLKDQNSLLKASKGGSFSGTGQGDMAEILRLQQEIDGKKKEIDTKNVQIEKLKEDLANQPPTQNGEQPISSDGGVSNENLVKLNSEIDALRRKVDQKDEEIKLYRTKYEDSNKQIAKMANSPSSGGEESDGSQATAAILSQHNQQSERITQLETELSAVNSDKESLAKQNAELEDKIKALSVETTSLQIQNKELATQKQKLEDDKQLATEESETAKKEQEDLLVLLADQDTKLKQYRSKLKELGQPVESDEDDDDFDDDDDDLDDEDD